MKAFKINQDGEVFILAAETNLGAIRCLCNVMSWDLDIDFDGSEEIEEIPEEKWDEVTVVNQDYDEEVDEPEMKDEYTLRETMEGVTKPYLIGSTVFD